MFKVTNDNIIEMSQQNLQGFRFEVSFSYVSNSVCRVHVCRGLQFTMKGQQCFDKTPCEVLSVVLLVVIGSKANWH